ncbi:exosome catalytic subunit dis3 [Tilletia horrida]|uniref:Ribosomal RNA-processing protein 44 n=1 Tax=Tilletia horrida TaxID=155126 RepID=A0AAN6GQA7_9BASI|nr:exosome catalytic subunit dis3 [Tilletia horrida]KAK0551278.1 exosome catalytic subunit dis3 [Tilletia horrida]KAK0567601.1 exosome catalytic subunit dis3 [Tilletia horrida]
MPLITIQKRPRPAEVPNALLRASRVAAVGGEDALMQEAHDDLHSQEGIMPPPLKKFFRKTARGKVLKVLRETYYRTDISCGSALCSECASLASTDSKTKLVLSADGMTNSLLGSGHYLLLDTNTVLHQMDVLESIADVQSKSSSTASSSSKPTFTDVIVLQTVMSEVKHRSMPLYKRLLALIAEPERRWHVFWNEFHAQTITQARPGESPNDQNDRAIRLATSWYRSHLFPTLAACSNSVPLEVILLSDDAENVRKAKDSGLPAMPVREYIKGLPNHDQLADLLSARHTDGAAGAERNAEAIYPQHIPLADLNAGVKTGALHQGYFNANAFNYLEATVRSSSVERPILIRGREAMNRAVDGDMVAVELLPKSQWRAPTDVVVDADVALRNDDPEDSEDDGNGTARDDLDLDEERTRLEKEIASSTQKSKSASSAPQPTGRIVGIVRRNWRSYVAHVDETSMQSSSVLSLGSQTLFASPVDRKIPRIRIRTRQASALVGQKILVAMDDWKPTSRYPDGHFVRALGAAETTAAEQESLLLENDIPYRPFSKAILDCLPAEGDDWKVPPKELGGPAWRDRVDLREEIICSIDPPGCQDIDDALHAKALPNGNIEAGVHIADVSYFVKPDNPMDAEAASRGTTVYLVDKRIDMLPHLLGTNLCSLRPYVERLAFSVIWEMTPSADIVNVKFHKSVIASKEAFTYEAAQKRKDNKKLNDPLTQAVRLLNTLAIKLKAKRMAAGALNLASPEVRIHMESAESTGPIDVEQKQMLETNSLVEEFMLLANCSVAERIYETFPQTAVLRRHVPPPPTNFELLQDILRKRRGMEIDCSSSKRLAESLDECVDPSQPEFNTLVRIMATRCMIAAEYFCSGSVSRSTFGHYGLACPMYTHFTSPIRRYADVLAHRQLAASINYDPLTASLHSRQHVDRVLHVVNKRHRSAQMAARASIDFYVGLAIARKNEEQGGSAELVAGNVKLREEAYVIRVFKNGVAVYVHKYGLEGLITFKQECQLDSESYQVTLPAAATGTAANVTLGVFDKCLVDIGVEKDKNTLRGKTKMALVFS